ncbi:3',5'-cyclic AMP phosphodiesterase CpdA [Polymorphobacter multimanifer]|uniref:3',5'-cyclic AMP phosphodiesterase CpdA n=2 Tax=Polymorphobacter multimanifer TaxID=1070431 RepID=A0A841L3E2_9SPHN|nr:phosphodiesterase [Polymorphobacter multimanifer]MBB6227144.1 3',5'-cyclic AMP phosphodiesterase CpdA [Polymorphobacter multimanifer]
MLIAQVTDIHLGFQPDDPAELNRKRFDDVVKTLLALSPRPDLLLATGDITEHGTIASYETFKALCDALPFPTLPALGNHDDRGNFFKVFPDSPRVGGFLQYCYDAGPLRVVVLDTLEEGRHGGSLDAGRAAWLDARLAEDARPTIVVLHHPPIETGNGWMTEDLDAGWVERLRAVVEKHSHIIRLVTGHLHRAIVTGWGGTTLAVCPSSAPQVAIDFRELDPEMPDGRDMIVAEGPGFALHYWTGRDLVTHFGSGGEHPVLARYNARMQPTVRHILAERVGESWGHD